MALKYNTIYDPLPVQMLLIENVKKPLLEGVSAIFDPNVSKVNKLRGARKIWRALQNLSDLPEPTIDEIWHPNCHNLIKIRDWVLSQLTLGDIRMDFIRNIFNLIIILYDFDCPWRWIMDTVKDKGLELEWKPRGYGDDWQDGYDWWEDRDFT